MIDQFTRRPRRGRRDLDPVSISWVKPSPAPRTVFTAQTSFEKKTRHPVLVCR